MKHYVYQRINVSGGRALHLKAHLALATRAFERVYGLDPALAPPLAPALAPPFAPAFGPALAPALDERETAARIAAIVRAKHSPARTGATVMLRLAPSRDIGENEAIRMDVEFERALLEAGYAHSPLRPRAVTFEYSMPYGGMPTNFAIEAGELYDFLAAGAVGRHGAARAVRCEGDRLLACGDAPLFAVHGRTLITPSLADGGFESVERALVIAAAGGARLSVREEPILHSELKNYDELFFADAAGITSLAECDGAKFMAIIAPKLVLQ
jgi:hypothetical protein